MEIRLEYIRVEVREVKDGELPPITLPKSGGHRRCYTAKRDNKWYLINLMSIGTYCNGVSYGELDDEMSTTKPEDMFRLVTETFLQEAIRKGIGDGVALIYEVNEHHWQPTLCPDNLTVIPA